MVNLETLKKDVYQRERKKLLHKFLFGNILLVLFLSITFSGTRVTEREKELMIKYRGAMVQVDSLTKLETNQLVILKENEDKIIRKSLSMSMDTTYIDKNLSINDLYDYANKQMSTYTSIEKVVDNRWDSINSIPTGLPITLADLYDINDGFGYRKHPIYKMILFHEGIDLEALVGSEVFAAGNGIVDKVIDNDKGYGKRIVIDHKNGYKTVYAHLDRFNVVVGQKVNKHDVIAYVGNTGSSTGPHLHYEILMKNRPVDPYKFFYIDASTKTLAHK